MRIANPIDQHRKVAGDGHLLDIDEAAYPEEYRKVVRWLNVAVSAPDIRRTMEVEDEILAELEDMERRVAGRDKVIEEKDKVIEAKDQVIGEKDRELAAKDRLIAELRGSR